ncbi:hypothetical protein CRV24_000034 [Beauveria bassiana]|nr:hypothetical protein CRV24_000034 [Beauveria bassiana]KAH8721457.1 hypothetical protein HC256_001811 [Beauveria bassiana]
MPQVLGMKRLIRQPADIVPEIAATSAELLGATKLSSESVKALIDLQLRWLAIMDRASPPRTRISVTATWAMTSLDKMTTSSVHRVTNEVT